MTVIILAGGKASRMGGRDKASLKIGKETLIKRQLRLLGKLFKKIIIVTNSPGRYRNLRTVRVIPDIVLGRGPLGGIFSGLLASQDDYNFVVACDMPFIDSDLIKYMYKQIKGYSVVVPKLNDGYEPLFGIYSKSCIKHIKSLLENKMFKINSLFLKVRTREVTKKEILKFDSPQRTFTNINTPKDLLELNTK